MKVIIECTLDDMWATPEEFAVMTDEDVIELCREDVSGLLDGAMWIVVRNAESHG